MLPVMQRRNWVGVESKSSAGAAKEAFLGFFLLPRGRLQLPPKT